MLRAHLGPLSRKTRGGQAGGRADRQFFSIWTCDCPSFHLNSSHLVSSRRYLPISSCSSYRRDSRRQISSIRRRRAVRTHTGGQRYQHKSISPHFLSAGPPSRAQRPLVIRLRVPLRSECPDCPSVAHRIASARTRTRCCVQCITYILYCILYCIVCLCPVCLRSERRRECSGGLIRSCRGASDGAAQMLPIIVSPDAQLSARLPSRRLIRDAAVAALATPALASARELLDAGYS